MNPRTGVTMVAAAVFLLAAMPSQAQLEPGDYQFEFTFDDRVRSYRLHVPESYVGEAVPLVLDYHGFSGSSGQQRSDSGFLQLSEEEGFLVAWPQGWGFLSSWNADTCCGQAQILELDDVGLAVDIVNRIADMTPIDAARVYATGLSNGGAMSHKLACDAADVFAATAPIAYPLAVNEVEDCQPSRPIPVAHLHGFSDEIVPYGGSGSVRSAQESFEAWAAIDGCTGDAERLFTSGISFCDVQTECDAGAVTALCSIDGPHVLYENAAGLDIARMAWVFLSRFSQ